MENIAFQILFKSISELIVHTKDWIIDALKAVVLFPLYVFRYARSDRRLRSTGDIWSIQAKNKKSSDYNLPKFLFINNFKGGVGKTTISANLIAAFALHHNLKVLAIDLDHQGSLTSMFRNRPSQGEKRNLMARWIVPLSEHEEREDYIGSASSTIAPIDLITADYGLAEVEDKEIASWIMSGSKKQDFRHRLADRLRIFGIDSDEYNLIVADGPPRLSLSSINALYCSSHVLIPVLPEPLAVRPLKEMFKRLLELHSVLGCKFKIFGVVVNEIYREGKETSTEQSQLSFIKDAIHDAKEEERARIRKALKLAESRKSNRKKSREEQRREQLYKQRLEELDDRFRDTDLQPRIPELSQIASPESGRLAYLKSPRVQKIFNELASNILKEMEIVSKKQETKVNAE